MLLTRRGVYLIRREGNLRLFQIITWADILARLEA
jgi:hypothetical protein